MTRLRYRITRRRIAGLAGLLCLLALAEINGMRYSLSPLLGVTHQVQMLLLVAGVALVAYGSGGLLTGRGGQGALRRGELAALVVILLAGMAVRTWNLQNAVHFYLDEGNFVQAVQALKDIPDVRVLEPFSHIANFTWVYAYTQMASGGIFGPALSAIRIPSVMFGVLSIAALYALARALFDRQTALIAAALLAAFPPHIHFSRLGMNNIADPLFGILALALLARGLRSGRRADYALAGVCLGLTQYFYEGGRLVLPVVALLWGGMATAAWRRRGRGLLVMVVVAAVIALPVYYTLYARNLPLTMRLNDTGMDRDFWLDVLLRPIDDGYLQFYLETRLLMPLQHFVTMPDRSEFYYGGRTALILPFMLPFFAAGIALLLWRRPVIALLPLLWLFFTALGNSLLTDNVWTARYVVAFPALVLLLALGLRGLLRLLERDPGWQRRQRFAGALVVGLLCAGQVGYYFGPHLALYNVQIRPHHDQQDVLFRSRDFPPDTEVYIVSDDPDIWLTTLHTLADHWGINIKVKHMLPDDLNPRTLPRDVDHAFFVSQRDRRTQSLLRDQLGLERGAFSPFNVPLEKQFLLYYYPAPDRRNMTQPSQYSKNPPG